MCFCSARTFALICLPGYWLQWYVDHVLSPGQDRELFYTNPKVVAAYKTFAQKVITRNNTITGVKVTPSYTQILAFPPSTAFPPIAFTPDCRP